MWYYEGELPGIKSLTTLSIIGHIYVSFSCVSPGGFRFQIRFRQVYHPFSSPPLLCCSGRVLSEREREARESEKEKRKDRRENATRSFAGAARERIDSAIKSERRRRDLSWVISQREYSRCTWSMQRCAPWPGRCAVSGSLRRDCVMFRAQIVVNREARKWTMKLKEREKGTKRKCRIFICLFLYLDRSRARLRWYACQLSAPWNITRQKFSTHVFINRLRVRGREWIFHSIPWRFSSFHDWRSANVPK